MTEKPTITYQDVEVKRRAFARALRDYVVEAKGRYHQPASELPADKLTGCEVLPNRLALLDRAPKGGVVAEIGVDRGDFSHEIAARVKPDMLHLFDIDESRIANAEIRRRLAAGDPGLKLHVGDSSALLSALPDAHFDMIYIDGDHTYAGVVKDIQAAEAKIKPGGMLIFNDYAVWSPQSMFHCGVAKAVHELCLRSDWKFRFIALQPMMYNDVALVRAG